LISKCKAIKAIKKGLKKSVKTKKQSDQKAFYTNTTRTGEKGPWICG